MKKLLLLVATFLFSLSLAQVPDLEGRVINIGSDTTYPPMETINPETGEVEGFDVDVMNALCERLNCVANFITTNWDGIFTALAQGEFDMVVSGVTITEERDQIVDFSDPYIITSQSILVRVEDEALTLEDFQAEGSELVLASQIGTTNANLAEELVGRERLKLFDQFQAALLALQNGDVDGVVIDGTSAGAYEQEFAGELVVNITGLNADPLGLVFQEGDALVDAFNAALEAIKADGTLDGLIAEYF
ncbi:MAG: transporter substrate-binding domain-containing protein [Trueperaceae bacterium]|nr:transporter substrate-binding domain-containing protein [Trueperaceae bacterium]